MVLGLCAGALLGAAPNRWWHRDAPVRAMQYSPAPEPQQSSPVPMQPSPNPAPVLEEEWISIAPSLDGVQHSQCDESQCPNIIMMLTDDHGFTDLGKAVDRNVETPVLDRMAKDGLRFQYGYSSAPQCVPSRAGLLSGRDQNMFGLYENNVNAGFGVDTLPPRTKVMTIAEHVHRLGYKTGMAGKWHLGSNSDVRTNPGARGFDEYMCGTTGHFFTNVGSDGEVLDSMTVSSQGTKESSHEPLRKEPRLNYDNRNRVDVTAEFTASFVMRHKDTPFFFVSGAPLEPPCSLVSPVKS